MADPTACPGYRPDFDSPEGEAQIAQRKQSRAAHPHAALISAPPEPKTSAAAGGVCECGHTKAEPHDHTD